MEYTIHTLYIVQYTEWQMRSLYIDSLCILRIKGNDCLRGAPAQIKHPYLIWPESHATAAVADMYIVHTKYIIRTQYTAICTFCTLYNTFSFWTVLILLRATTPTFTEASLPVLVCKPCFACAPTTGGCFNPVAGVSGVREGGF